MVIFLTAAILEVKFEGGAVSCGDFCRVGPSGYLELKEGDESSEKELFERKEAEISHLMPQ